MQRNEHAKENVCAHARLEMMMDGPDLEIHGLERAERPFHRAQSLVVPHGIAAVHRSLGDARTDDIDAIERRFGSNLFAQQRELEAVIGDGELEVLGHLVLVDDLSNSHPDLATPLELAACNHVVHLLKLLSGRRNQRVSLMCAQLRKLRIAAGDEPLAGEVGVVRELEQIALIKESELQLSIVDEGVDLPAL